MGENVERWKMDFWPSDYMICANYGYNDVIFKFDVEVQWQHFCAVMPIPN